MESQATIYINSLIQRADAYLKEANAEKALFLQAKTDEEQAVHYYKAETALNNANMLLAVIKGADLSA